MNNISSEDSPLRNLFYLSFICFIVITSSNILYCIDMIYTIYIKKKPKFNKTDIIL